VGTPAQIDLEKGSAMMQYYGQDVFVFIINIIIIYTV
jgi:hypothetical protein